MLEFIRGLLFSCSPDQAVVEAQGVGYKLQIPANVASKLSSVGTVVLLYCSHIVREDSETLYGFLDSEQRDLFELLIGISGIGPKTALNLVGRLQTTEIHQAVIMNDQAKLSSVPGIGKKTAERLIVELKGKKMSTFVAKSPLPSASSLVQDACAALLNLGFSQASAEKAVQKALEDFEGEPEISDLIASALRRK